MLATIVILIALGLDVLAVSLSLGIAGLSRDRWLRVSLTFALFEGLMPVIGLLIGEKVGTALGDIGGYLAGAVLIGVGALAIKEALWDDDDKIPSSSPSSEPLSDDQPGPPANTNGPKSRYDKIKGWRLLVTGLSISLDELAVGFSLGVLQVSLGPALLYIGVQSFVLTFLGLSLGRKLGRNLGERAELASGIILAALGSLLIGEQFLHPG